MATRPVPLTGLYAFSAICALFATGYGLLHLDPSPGMSFLLGWGPAIAVAWWLAADSKRMHVIGTYDAGLFFYLTWPLTLPWYAVRSRGRAGWALAVQLYAVALVGPLGFLWGGLLRMILVS
ncbi:MAG TPA: hypothetical protein VFN08_15350 [Gemmatimonadales bacterium]|jgi:hypothetical protein|nr:hypothetical protein [Gemmatimonadales bacterium]